MAKKPIRSFEPVTKILQNPHLLDKGISVFYIDRDTSPHCLLRATKKDQGAVLERARNLLESNVALLVRDYPGISCLDLPIIEVRYEADIACG